MKYTRLAQLSVLVGLCFMLGCSTAPETREARQDLATQVQSTLEVAKRTDPGLQRFFDTAAGYAAFPEVGKGAVGVGGAYGRGMLFEAGRSVGYCTLTQASIGLALGGQSYSELIFFEDQEALNRFKAGNYTFAAQASAVALKSGASANAKYAEGVAVFTFGEAGLMAEASIGGQKFSYEPMLGTEPAVRQATSQ